MHSYGLWLKVVAASFVFSYSDSAETVVSCSNTACLGQPFEITCDITGDISSGISWNRPDAIEVVTCNAQLDCVSQNSNYESTGRTLKIKSFGKKDQGSWNCRDGSNGFEQRCNVNTTLRAPKGKLKASCDPKGEKLVPHCSGITFEGVPAVTIVEDFEQGNGKCSLSGEAVKCVVAMNTTDEVSCGDFVPDQSSTIHGLIGGLVAACVAAVVFAFLFCRVRNARS